MYEIQDALSIIVIFGYMILFALGFIAGQQR